MTMLQPLTTAPNSNCRNLLVAPVSNYCGYSTLRFRSLALGH
jgi:hypothetical protein